MNKYVSRSWSDPDVPDPVPVVVVVVSKADRVRAALIEQRLNEIESLKKIPVAEILKNFGV